MSVTFPEISGSQQKEIIETGFEFMRALISAYGDERATEIWDSFTDAIDPDIRREMLLAMLKTGGNLGKTISLDKINPGTAGNITSGLVASIKALRTVVAGGMGLKEAKDLVEFVRDSGPQRIAISDTVSRIDAMRTFRDAGCKVS